MKIDDNIISGLKEKQKMLVQDKNQHEAVIKVLVDSGKAQYVRDIKFSEFIFECANNIHEGHIHEGEPIGKNNVSDLLHKTLNETMKTSYSKEEMVEEINKVLLRKFEYSNSKEVLGWSVYDNNYMSIDKFPVNHPRHK